MSTAALNLTWWMWRILKPSWLFGPIFDKELRISSRRKRNYVLRSVYLAVLSVFVVLVWFVTISIYSGSSVVYQISRMSVAGKAIVSTIIWFQFCTTQLLAVIMLSNAISDEIYHKTLGVLMTTPINSFQIVMGKLFSKLWQLLILMAISIPLLAIVRVFGGVSWGLVISSVCINLTAVIFAGAVSIYFSIRSKYAYAVILRALFVGGVLYLFLPLVFLWFPSNFSGSEKYWLIVVHSNPFVSFGYNYALVTQPNLAGSGPFFSWPLHCGVMLAASALVLGSTARAVRKVALRQVTGEAGIFANRKHRRARKKAERQSIKVEAATGKIKRVSGSPIIWKELRTPILKGGKVAIAIKIAIVVIVLLVSYIFFSFESLLDNANVHTAYSVVFVILGVITTATLSATSITSEKEARPWPILLATPLGEWHIIAGKAVGIFRRCLPVWLLLAVHMIIFTAVGYIHPVTMIHMAVLATWIVVFFTGTGLYFSSLFKRTTPAVIMNFGLGLILWVIAPMFLGQIAAIFAVLNVSGPASVLFCVLLSNPIAQVVILMGSGVSLDYNWPDGLGDGVIATSVRVVIFAVFYILVGAFFAWRAKCRLRRNIF